MKFNLIFQLFSSKYFEKSCSSMTKGHLKFYFKDNSCFILTWLWLWAVELLLIWINISHIVCFMSYHSICIKWVFFSIQEHKLCLFFNTYWGNWNAEFNMLNVISQFKHVHSFPNPVDYVVFTNPITNRKRGVLSNLLSIVLEIRF